MYTIQEMNNWNYSTAWQFFTNNAFNKYIPETELYVRSLQVTRTFDLRDDKDAREKILESIKPKTLILVDGSSLNGKTTFAQRLACNVDAEVVDIDIICKEWIEEQISTKTPFERFKFLLNFEKLTDIYILENLEKIIKQKSNKNKTVILVGSYLELIYRSIIVKTLGKYFNQVVSIYCCSKSFKDIKVMMKKREQEYGEMPEEHEKILKEYNFSKRLLESNGFALGIGMNFSFVIDVCVSNMFV